MFFHFWNKHRAIYRSAGKASFVWVLPLSQTVGIWYCYHLHICGNVFNRVCLYVSVYLPAWPPGRLPACLRVCVSVRAITFEPLGARNFIFGKYIFTISRLNQVPWSLCQGKSIKCFISHNFYFWMIGFHWNLLRKQGHLEVTVMVTQCQGHTMITFKN